MKLAFIHTSHVLIPLFAQLAKEHLQGVEVFHMSDESLIRNTMAAGTLTKSTTRRVIGMIGLARDGGADAVLVTCSSIGAAIPVAREQFDFPILRIDEAMADAAVRAGRRIGVAATVRTTLEPTIALLRESAVAAQRDVEIVPELCEGAFEAVLSGDTARHDALVSVALGELRKRVDVVVLAQASMVRVLNQMDLTSGAPFLSSPELAVRSARAVLS
jgi:Asp/Glu/hydantoin racemase